MRSFTPSMLGIGGLGGGVGAIVGIGGGNVMMPLMTLLCGAALTQHQMSATSLVAVVATGTSAAATYLLNGHVDPFAAVLITTAASLGSPLGARLQASLSARKLKIVLAVFVLLCAPLVPLKGWLVKRAGATAEAPESMDSQGVIPGSGLAAGPAAVISATGLLAGIFSGLLGIGGGVVLTPALALATDLPQQSILGTSLAAMVLPSMVGAAVHHRAGNIVWRAAWPLAIGAGLGAAVGSRVASALPEEELRWIFAAVMGAVGAYMLRGALRAPIL